MTPAKKLGTGIYFSAEQAFPALLLILCSFLKTFAIILFDAGAGIFFLQSYEGLYVPYILISMAVLLFILLPVLSVLKDRNVQMPSRLMAAAAVFAVLFYVLMISTASKVPSLILMTGKEALYLMAEGAFWITAFRCGLFKNRIKTLGGVLVAQAFAALFAAGAIELTAASVSLNQLILWSAVFFLASAFLLNLLIANGSAPIAERLAFLKQNIRHSGSVSDQKKLYIYLFTAAGLLFFSAGIFEYYFLTSTAAAAHEQTASVISTFSAVYALMSVFIFAYLMVSAVGKVNPFTLLYLIPAATAAAAAGGFFNIFGLIVTAKAVVSLVTLQAKESALQTLPLIISLRTGFRATILRKTAIEPFALLLSGLFLLWAENAMTEEIFLYFMLGLAAVTLAVLLLLRKTYVRLSLNMLKGHLWRGGRLILMGRRMQRHLNQALNSPDADEAVYALRILEESLTTPFLKRLREALNHPNPAVRLFALEKVEALNFRLATPEVIALAESDKDHTVRRTAIRVMCRLGDAETREKAVSFINETDLREGALVGLLAVGQDGVFVAIEKVSELSVSLEESNRILAATVLGEAGNPAFYHPLITLLNDWEPPVCRAALTAAGRLLHPRLIPAVMDTFRIPELREDAIAALLQFKEKAFPEIHNALMSPNNPFQFRIVLAKTVGRMHTPAAEKFLFGHIDAADRRVRFHIVKSLALQGFKAAGKNINTVRLCLYDEIEEATNILAALEVFEKNTQEDLTPSLDNLKTALNGEIGYVKERILLLLALLQPSQMISDLLDNPALSEKEKDAEKEKIVDKILSGELRTLCLPLFQNKTTTQKLAHLRPHFFPPVLSFDGYLLDIIKTPPGELTDWTRASAIYTAGFLKNATFVNSLAALLTDSDAIIRETAVWALGRILPQDEAARLIAENLTDTAPPVARMTRFVTDGAGRIVF